MEDSIVTLFKNKILDNDKMTTKQKAILDASINLFAEKGFANTSTSEISKLSGAAEGTIFKHFGSKENLLIATIIPFLIDDIFPEVAKQFSKTALEIEHTDLKSFFKIIVSDRVNFLNENNKIGKIFINEILYSEDIRNKLITLIPSEIKVNFYKVLDNFKEKGLLVDWPNEVIIRFIMTNIASYGISKYTLFPNKPWDDEKEIDYIAALLSKGLSK